LAIAAARLCACVCRKRARNSAVADAVREGDNMKSQKTGRSQPPPQKLYQPTPAQLASVHKLALAWRDAWRREVAAGAGATGERGEAPVRAVPRRRSKDEATRRAEFASAIARDELGRHYWDGRKPSERSNRKGRAPQSLANGKAPK
jgi:hypothetical protein